MTKKSIIFSLFCASIFFNFQFSIFNSLQAQSSSAQLLKKARKAAYGWIRNYSTFASLRGRSAVSDFSRCFSSMQDTLFLDYLPLSSYPFHKPYTTLEEYINIRSNPERRHNISYAVSNFAITGESSQGDIVTLQVSWNETLKYVPVSLTNLLRYPDFLFKVTSTLQYNSETDEIVARNLRLYNQDNVPEFIVLHTPQDNIKTTREQLKDKVNIDNRSLILAASQQCPEDEKFYIEVYDTLTNRFGIQLAMGSGSLALDFSHADRYSDIHADASTFSIGLNYFCQFKLWGSSRLGIEFSPVFRSIDHKYGFDYYDYFDDVDPVGDAYKRRVRVGGYEEKLRTTSVSLPITLRYDFFIPSEKVSFFGRLGVAPSYAISRNVEASAQTVHASGYYESLYGVELDQNGIYDFGEWGEAQKSFSEENTSIPALYVEGVVGLGVAYWFGGGFSAELSANYTPLVFQQTEPASDYHLSTTGKSWNPAAYDIDKMLHHLFNFMLQINYHF